MKLLRLTALILGLFTNTLYAQTQTDDSPKGKFFFGVEMGTNNPASLRKSHTVNFQGGLLAEYYIAKHWIVNARLKYFQTALDFDMPRPSNGPLLIATYNRFDGAVISMPVNIKWEFRIFKGLHANLKLGAALNYEVKSDYSYDADLSTDYPRLFASLNYGLGFSYHISPRLHIFLNVEDYRGAGAKHPKQVALFDNENHINNSQLNLGVQYHFK